MVVMDLVGCRDAYHEPAAAFVCPNRVGWRQTRAGETT